MKIEVKNLCFSYGEINVLNNISFSSSAGQLISLLGANGAGKTTLFRCMLGFLPPQSGQVLIDQKDINNLSAKDKSGLIAYIPQSFNPAFNLSVLDSVLLGASREVPMFGVPDSKMKDRAVEILKSLGIEHLSNRGITKISGGERQLVLLARAMMQNAKIFVMDEPTSSLDYANCFMVMQKITQLRDAGYTIFCSTHDPQLALRYSDRILALKNGTLVADSSVQEIIDDKILSSLYSINVAVNTVKAGSNEYKVCTPYA